MGSPAFAESLVPATYTPLLTGNGTPAAHWKAVDAGRAAWVARWRRRLVQQLIREWRERVVSPVQRAASEASALAHVERALLDGAANWEDVLFQIYGEVGRDFAMKTARGLKAQSIAEVKAGTDAAARLATIAASGPDGWLDVVASWLSTEAGKHARAIQGATLATVREVITARIRQGDGIPAIARHLRQIEPGLTSRRAVVIARTEVIAASNLGARAGAIATGLDLQHEWIATPGAQTRAQHAAANGQVKPMDEPFVVAGQRLMFPGDASLGAHPWNLINCRCAVGYRAE